MANLFREFTSVLTLTKYLQTTDTRNKDFIILRILRTVVNMEDKNFCISLKKILLAYEIYHFGSRLSILYIF